MKLSSIKISESPQSVLVYGPAKSGKTRLAGLLARAGYKLIWVDLEKGLQTLLSTLTPEEQENVTYIAIPDTSTNPIAIETVGRMFASAKPLKVCWEHGKIDCISCMRHKAQDFTVIDLRSLGSDTVVVIDSLTQLSDSALNHATKDIQANLLATANKAGWDEYGYQGMLLKNVLSNMQQARFHRVFISHEDIVEQTDKTEIIFPVCGTRAFSRQAARYFDHVVYCYRMNNKHKSASGTSFRPNVMSGSRTDIEIGSGETGGLECLLRGEAPSPRGDGAAKNPTTGANLHARMPLKAAAALQPTEAAKVVNAASSATDLLAKLKPNQAM